MSKAQWMLLLAVAASSYSVGTIWMVQTGYRLWPLVGPAEFGVYHRTWWLRLIPVVFPVAGVALLASVALLWWRPPGVSAAAVWCSVGLQLLSYLLTAFLWAPWQARTSHARLPDGSLDPTYALIMDTHWIRVALLTASGLVSLWMLAQFMASRPSP